jgi:nucleoside-diphosphate-sugar epimerase
MMRVNATGTANVVNAALAAGVKKLLHVSSTAALGRHPRMATIDENAVWKKNNNNSVYALSKYLAEREVWRGTQEGLPAVIVNPSVIIGPGDWLRGTPRLFHACRHGLPVYPRGTNAFVSVHDVVRCMTELMNGDVENERFIVTAENVSYKNFFTWATQALGVSGPSVALPNWITSITWRVSALLHKTLGVYPLLTRETARTVNGTFLYSNEKIKSQLGVEFVPAKQFITRTAEAYKTATRSPR